MFSNPAQAHSLIFAHKNPYFDNHDYSSSDEKTQIKARRQSDEGNTPTKGNRPSDSMLKEE